MKILPGRLTNSRNLTVVRKLAETDTAKIKIAHIATFASATETPAHHAGLKFGLL